MEDCYGRLTPLPWLSSIVVSHHSAKSIERLRPSCPLSALSENCRRMVVSPLKRPNDGQRRVTFRSGWTLSLHVTWE